MIILEEKAEENDKNTSIECDWEPCDNKSSDKNLLINHIDTYIGNKIVKPATTLVGYNLSCNLCNFETEKILELETYMKRQREQNICPTDNEIREIMKETITYGNEYFRFH